jgi:hypothetical protein
MANLKKTFWHFLLPLIVWAFIALVAFSSPMPEEPEDMPSDAWSYYSGRSPLEQFLLKNRNMVLVVLFLFAIIIDFILWFVGYRR